MVTENSPLIGHTLPAQLEERYEIGVLAVSRSGERSCSASRRSGFKPATSWCCAPPRRLPERLGELRVLPLAERSIALGPQRPLHLPALILAVAMALVAFRDHRSGRLRRRCRSAAPDALMTMHEAYDTMEWHVLILLGALIPISHAMATRRHRSAGRLADPGGPGSPGVVALGIVLVHHHGRHAVPAQRAHRADHGADRGQRWPSKLGYNLDPFLMAVALGAGCDFLTPIGHQCNTLVMGPGRLPLRRLSPPRGPLSLHRHRGRTANDHVGLAAARMTRRSVGNHHV